MQRTKRKRSPDKGDGFYVSRMCTATALALVALLICAGAALAVLPKKGARFQGRTTQADPQGRPAVVKFSVSGGGGLVQGISIDWIERCNSGAVYYTTTRINRIRISRRGEFRFSGPSPGHVDGRRQEATVRFAGRFVRRTEARGTFSGTAVVLDVFGNPVDYCRTEPVAWRAPAR